MKIHDVIKTCNIAQLTHDIVSADMFQETIKLIATNLESSPSSKRNSYFFDFKFVETLIFFNANIFYELSTFTKSCIVLILFAYKNREHTNFMK